MAISKKLDKIIDGFYVVYDKYHEAIQGLDRKGIIKYGKELAEYLGEHRKDLKISDEYISELNEALDNLEKTLAKSTRKKNQVIKPYLSTEAEKQDYFQALLRELPIGRKRTEH